MRDAIRWRTVWHGICSSHSRTTVDAGSGNDERIHSPNEELDDVGVRAAAGRGALNQNGVKDFPAEDVNRDGVIDVLDCRTPSGAYDPVGLHKGYFTENAYTGTSQCLNCHGKIGDDVMKTAHWNWEGTVSGIKGFEGTIHGKKDLLNNFCLAVPTNEGRCNQCHISYGWGDKNFDFGNPKNIDCLACHDQTGTYKKVATPNLANPPLVGGPDPSVDLQKVAQSVGLNQGVPPRSTCVFCHSRAGGDDNVKHGDISTRMGFAKATDPAADPAKYLSRSEDVHMGYDPVTQKGGDMTCVACHQVKKDVSGNMIDHGIGGFMYHSVDEGVMKDCEDCHGSAASIHAGSSVELVLNSQAHARLACQVCHIPAFARKVATYVDWKWSLAGQDARPADCAAAPTGVAADGVTQRGTYAKMKGCFTWATNVRPVLRFYDGKWNRVIVGFNNAYTTTPVDLGSPSATYRDPAARIYPFKKMTGRSWWSRISTVPRRARTPTGRSTTGSARSPTRPPICRPTTRARNPSLPSTGSWRPRCSSRWITRSRRRSRPSAWAATAPTATSPTRSIGRHWAGRRTRPSAASRRCPDRSPWRPRGRIAPASVRCGGIFLGQPRLYAVNRASISAQRAKAASSS